MKTAAQSAIDRIRAMAPPTGDARRAMMDERLSPMAQTMLPTTAAPTAYELPYYIDDMGNVTLKGNTLEGAFNEFVGLDQGVDRNMFIPWNQEAGWHVPELLRGAAQSAYAPGHVAGGGAMTMDETLQSGVDIGGTMFGGATLFGPRNALAMGGGKAAGLLDNVPVSSRADDLAEQIRAAHPQLQVEVNHSSASWGDSSYLRVGREGQAGTQEIRVSDHGVGPRRFGEAIQVPVDGDFDDVLGEIGKFAEGTDSVASAANALDAAIQSAPRSVLDDIMKFPKDTGRARKILREGGVQFDGSDSQLRNALNRVLEAGGDVARVADDLPMDTASQMARAREQGLDVDTYHGTGDDIRVIDPNEFGKSQSLMGDALYSSTTTKRPNIYAQGKPDPARRGEPQDGANIMPLKVRSEGMLDLTRQMNPDESSRIAKTFENAGAEVTTREDGSFFVEYEGRSAFVDNYRPMDSNFKSLRDAFGMKNLQEVLEESGFTGVIGAEGNGSKVYANYRGQDVRSRFAKFDPRNIKSSDVLASGVGGLLGLGLLNANEAEAGQ